MSHKNSRGGYESSAKRVTDLAPPPAGPAPGGSPTTPQNDRWNINPRPRLPRGEWPYDLVADAVAEDFDGDGFCPLCMGDCREEFGETVDANPPRL